MKHELISQQINEVEQQAISDTRKRDVKIKLYKYQTAWGRKHRRISLSGVSDPAGKAITDPECVAAELAAYWGQVHSCVDCSEEDRQLLSDFVQPCPPEIIWKLEPQEFACLLSKVSDSAPGLSLIHI
eukprot:8253816-Pyramimonas_sp.AAC.1